MRFSWWVAWFLVCIPAGAAAGWGYVEFLPRYPSGGYDGGFAGDLILFGGMMALVQSPFIAVFGWYLSRLKDFSTALSAVFLAVVWTLAGFAGWTLGAMIEVFFGIRDVAVTGDFEVAGRTVRWLTMGFLEGLLLAAACVLDSRGSSHDASSTRRMLLRVIVPWTAATGVGGLLFETWAASYAASGDGRFSGTGGWISDLAGNLGTGQNIADVVVPYGVMLPVLYGLLTGAVISYSARDPRTSP